MRSIFALIKLFLFTILSLVIVPSQLLVLLFSKGSAAYILPQIWHKGVCIIFGISFEVKGAPVNDRQVIFMSNHLSYLDIPLIGSLLRASFLAKKDVESWPVFGFLSKLQQTAFIERKRSAVAREAKNLEKRFDSGRNLILFPEGTSTDGRDVDPFKSSLFKLVLDANNPDIVIQPMTIKLLEVDGQAPDSQNIRDLYAWHRDMDTELPEHLWLFAKTSGAKLELIFHDPIIASEFEDRKILAKTCHERVSNGLGFLVAA